MCHQLTVHEHQAMLVAHRALEETVLTREQNTFKPLVSQRWADLVYRGFFYDPLREDLDASYLVDVTRFTR